MLTSLKFNLSNAPIRRDTLHGRRYVVAPMVMLTEGVHNGSGGPLLYRESECRKAAPAWNMKPIVVYHPNINGQGVSACDPDILERQQVGVVMRCIWNGKLRAEAWIDEERADLVDNRIIEALDGNKLMEVSTGLFTENTGEPGVWNGEEYNAEATNHQPDHLALLPDQIGACSIADGAGLLQLNEAAECSGINITPLLAREMDLIRRLVGNAMSHSDTYTAITTALRNRLGMKDVWPVDVYDKYFVYDMGDGKKLYRLDYTTQKGGGVEITGDPVEVTRVTEYRPVSNAIVGNESQDNHKEKGMDKKKLIDALIANAKAVWNEDDRTALEAFDEDTLTKLNEALTDKPAEEKPEAQTPAPTPAEVVAPKENKAMTTAEYIAAAPAEIRDVLTNGLAAHEAQKTELVGKIMANANNKFSQEFLAAKSLQELQGLAALATTEAPAPAANYGGRVPMFAGQFTPAAPTANAANGEDNILPLPVINFEN